MVGAFFYAPPPQFQQIQPCENLLGTNNPNVHKFRDPLWSLFRMEILFSRARMNSYATFLQNPL
ncbi:hypothetical protein C8R32_10737 [Nitrosospira sp. Nsp5]|uniref:Uncharacterized protein n=1 Tax=Nitrosospira multiformis TaxID=1231 RepID=A0ABY0T8C5_9PROT|nr:hypothetical protein C8R32_10737 [Nitrosospira sp. Nsp5]SDQ43312.1 hypothetical protein SAMN05216402_0831 [Nitrosospira multiformis]